MILLILLLSGLLLCGIAAAQVSHDGGFVNHGIGAPVSESRGIVPFEDEQGRSWAVILSTDQGARGWINMVDIDSGETQQIYYPEAVPNSDPFASLISSQKRLYTGVGKVLVEFDLASREWLFHGIPDPSAYCFVGAAFAEDPDGTIYVGTYPQSNLCAYDPDTQEMRILGRLDPVEQYLSYLALDDAGWIYGGIGTARFNIVGMNLATGEIRQLVPEEERALGTALVLRGTDGRVYGRAGGKVYRLFAGESEVIEPAEQAPSAAIGALGWGRTTTVFPDGRRVTDVHLPDRRLMVQDTADAQPREVRFDYESGGAALTSMIAGPNDMIYASTAHPMHFVRLDTAAGVPEDFGPVNRVGGGNFCAMDVQGPYIAAASYALGIFHLFDTRKPFDGGYGDDPNPREIAQYREDIARPRACVAHPDGEHVIMTGYAGYGLRGGGMGIVNITTGEDTLITHDDLMPDHSTVSLRAFADGNLVGGTAIDTPGGGRPIATEAEIYLFDWESKTVVFRMVPIPEARSIMGLEIGPDGLVYGVTNNADLFVFDPQKREIVHTENFTPLGGPPREALITGPEGTVIVLFGKAIVRITPGTFTAEKLADTPVPVRCGRALVGGRLYFGSGASIWSYDLNM